MRLLFTLVLISVALYGCDADRRVIEVIDAHAMPVANATVSIVPCIDQATSKAITDANGRAQFGTGRWNEVGEVISVKIEKNNSVLHDAVRPKPEGSLIRIRVKTPSKPET